MPRIYTSTNDPLDFCLWCFPSEPMAETLYGNPNTGGGPDGRGSCFSYDADHPGYGGESYLCTRCGRLLTDGDNYPL